jgi:cystathionine gamma-synthase
MAALFHLIRSLARRDPGRRTVQLGFPYVDTLKLQKKIGAGVLFLPQGDGDDVERLDAALQSERFAALLCEIPTNPLLRSPPLARVSRLVRSRDVPLIVDDTIGSFANLDLIPFADVLVASLTKIFSGHGDVMGGAIVLNAASPFHGALAQQLAAEHEDLVWAEDAIALAENHRSFGARTARINRTAEELSDFLAAHPAVERVFYPKLETPESYRACMKPDGGYGGLLSILLKDAPRTAPTFFDALDVCKGPGFGTCFTLAAPYTLLAHYRELEWAEACGIPRDLVRVSVGLEEAGDLRDRFSRALQRATSGAARRTEPQTRQVVHGGQS